MLVDLWIALLVLVYALACWRWPKLDFWVWLISDPGAFDRLTETLTTSSALVTGFAGVVVVFGLQSDSKRFRQLRIDGGKALQSSWSSVSASGFLALAAGFLAVIAFGGPLQPAGPWLVAVGTLLLTHSGIRLLWLLRMMASTVKGEDFVSRKSEKVIKTSSIPFKRNGGSPTE